MFYWTWQALPSHCAFFPIALCTLGLAHKLWMLSTEWGFATSLGKSTKGLDISFKLFEILKIFENYAKFNFWKFKKVKKFKIHKTFKFFFECLLNVFHIFNKCPNSRISPSYIRFDVITREQPKLLLSLHAKKQKTCRSTPRSGNFIYKVSRSLVRLLFVWSFIRFQSLNSEFFSFRVSSNK